MVLNSILTKSQISIQNISLGQWRAWRQRAQLGWSCSPGARSGLPLPQHLQLVSLLFCLFFFFHFIFPVVCLSQILEAISWFLLCHRQEALRKWQQGFHLILLCQLGKQGLGLLLSTRRNLKNLHIFLSIQNPHYYTPTFFIVNTLL